MSRDIFRFIMIYVLFNWVGINIFYEKLEKDMAIINFSGYDHLFLRFLYLLDMVILLWSVIFDRLKVQENIGLNH